MNALKLATVLLVASALEAADAQMRASRSYSISREMFLPLHQVSSAAYSLTATFGTAAAAESASYGITGAWTLDQQDPQAHPAVVPVISVAEFGGGELVLKVVAEPNQAVEVEVSVDLQNWQTVASTNLTTPEWIIRDPVVPVGARFYRAVSPKNSE